MNKIHGQSRSTEWDQVSSRDRKAAGGEEPGVVWIAQLFLVTLMVPYVIKIGTLVLLPHRVLLLILFIPLFFRLFVLKKSGPVLSIDWLLLGSAIWAGPSLLWNHPFNLVAEPFGIHLLEFFGAYLTARVSIRNSADFRKFVKLLFLLILFLLPFAALESFTRRPILIDLLPQAGIASVDAGIRLGLRRAQTIFAHPILYGVFVSTGLGLFWYSIRPRWLRYPSVPIVLMATAFSLSTGALLSVVTQSVLISWEYAMKRVIARWRIFVAFSLLIYIAVDLLSSRTPFHVLVTYATFSTGSAYNRILIWQYGLDNVLENPLFGLGMNDWIRPSWMSSSTDNFWLLLTMRYGLPAIIMIFVAITSIIRRIGRTELSCKSDSLSRSAYLVTIGGIIIAGGTVHYWHAMMAFVMFVFGSGIWLISGGTNEASVEPTLDVAKISYGPAYSRRPINPTSSAVENSPREALHRRGRRAPPL